MPFFKRTFLFPWQSLFVAAHELNTKVKKATVANESNNFFIRFLKVWYILRHEECTGTTN
jgi:hypothetical protein